VSPDNDRRHSRPPTSYTEEEAAQRTQEFIRASNEIIEVRAALDERFPDIARASLDLIMASLIIENNLGREWVARHIDGPRRSANSNYLRSEPTNSMERHERYVRIMELARRIFELGQERFAERLFNNLRRRDLEGAAFEADVVRMLIALPVFMDLREERGIKGDDYDIDLWLRIDHHWLIEVKTRADSTSSGDYLCGMETNGISHHHPHLLRRGG
jgi:hypothetical protein